MNGLPFTGLSARHRVGLWLAVFGLMFLSLSCAAYAWRLPPVNTLAPLSVTIEHADKEGVLRTQHANGIRFMGDSTTAQVRVRADVAPVPADGAWVLWVSRDSLVQIQIQDGAADYTQTKFYQPGPEQGLLPTGYLFALRQGVDLREGILIEPTFGEPGALEVRLFDADNALALSQRMVVGSVIIYAVMFTLAITALTLLLAMRDAAFLYLFGATFAALLMLGAHTGQLYVLPVFSFLAGQGMAGVLMLTWVACAFLLLSATAYANVGAGHRRINRGLSWLLLALVPLALVLPGSQHWLLSLALTGGWAMTYAAVLVCLGVAVLRRRPFAVSLLMAWFALLGFTILRDGLMRGLVQESLLVRFGYQFALVLVIALLVLGMIQSLAQLRLERDEQRNQRLASDRRAARAIQRSQLVERVQRHLRETPSDELAARAMGLLSEHLAASIPVNAVALLHWRERQPALLVLPEHSELPSLRASVQYRQAALMRRAVQRSTFHTPIAAHTVFPQPYTEWALSYELEPGAWLLVLMYTETEQTIALDDRIWIDHAVRMVWLGLDQAKANAELRQRAQTDPLTGVASRGEFDAKVRQLQKPANAQGRIASALFVDVDLFKTVNDTYGHSAGDACLREVATTINSRMRRHDLLARYGGEEFVVLLEDTNIEQAQIVAEAIRERVEAMQMQWQGQPIALTVSIGVASGVLDDGGINDVIERADAAVYQAKAAGRNHVFVSHAANKP